MRSASVKVAKGIQVLTSSNAIGPLDASMTPMVPRPCGFATELAAGDSRASPVCGALEEASNALAAPTWQTSEASPAERVRRSSCKDARLGPQTA